jgi:zinc transporter ZupT
VDSSGYVQVQEPLPFAVAVAQQQQQQQQNGGAHAAGFSDAARAAAPSPVGIMQLYDQPAHLAGLAAAGSEAYKHVDSQPVVPYTLLLLLCYLVPYGMQVAGAAKANLEEAVSLGLPLALLALPLGAALGGVLSTVLGQRKRLVAGLAAALYSVAPLTAGGILAALPIGVVPAEEIAFDGAATGGALAAVAAGALVAAGLLVCWPAAGRSNGSRAGAGVFVGAAVTLLVCAVLGALCMGTPYCLAGSVAQRG